MRGNPFAARQKVYMLGSIPACAGEPRKFPTACCASRVYPRVCGGTSSCCWSVKAALGLSPRVRGNRHPQRLPRLLNRSIPACAGEPLSSLFCTNFAKVYPRVCGGTSGRQALHRIQGGLSPRVRGNHAAAIERLKRERSIPACAGEPFFSIFSSLIAGVYPRVCGGTPNLHNTNHTAEGLSPRVRGNPSAISQATRPTRSIPACAGEPGALRDRNTGSTVYPRVCGGTNQPCLNSQSSIGLSPRVRGNP